MKGTIATLFPNIHVQMQYVYIHESLAEYLVCGDTSFAVMNARIEIRKLGVVEDHKTGFQKQFEVCAL